MVVLRLVTCGQRAGRLVTWNWDQQRNYWRNKIGKASGCCGSVLVHLSPAPRGTGTVSAPVPKKLLMMASIDNCCTSARGCTATLGNFAKATFGAISKTYSYLTLNLLRVTVFTNLLIRNSLTIFQTPTL
ncbi:hypothetical protein U0070_024212 [Myodes glareolus]|uniref:Small ribosomal subunit protein uS5 n=1 Tax=Myodes glareolus TaxID=447135 RepID=A0AAW0IA27_MYOGA